MIIFIEEWPTLVLQFTFANQWHSALVNIFLPSLLIFSVALFAQWKRRKMQVIVTATSIICIVIMVSQYKRNYVRSKKSPLAIINIFKVGAKYES